MSETLLTVEQIAERLQVSESWVYKKCRAKIIPCIKIGKLTRFSERVFDDWIKGHAIKGALKV